MKFSNIKLRVLALIVALVIITSTLTACPLDFTTVQSSSSTTTKKPTGSVCESAHLDVDDDGWCDKCDYDVVETVDFYNFNDLHGKFSDTDEQEGVDELTAYLERREGLDDHVVILSTGDMWQGSSESNITKGALITDWMNYLGFEAMALGNHEFDWGVDYIKANAELAQFPFLAINIIDTATGKRADFCEASTLIERGGAKIGIIGAIGDCYSSILGEMTKGVHFLVGDDLTALVKAESDALRAAGADFIVYLIHDGGSYRDVGNTASYYDQQLSRDGYVDLVFEGHSHSYYYFVDNYGVPHLQGGGDNSKGMTHVEVDINFANGNIKFAEYGYVTHSQASVYGSSPIVDSLIEKYWEEISRVYRELGYNSRYRSSSEIGSTVAKLYYEAGVEKWGKEYNIVLGGGSINTRSPYDIESGTVKYSDLQMILPFDNKIMLCSISGRDLINKFLNNSKYYTYCTLSASEIDPNATYYIIADSWTSSYDWANCTEITAYDNETFARDLLAKYVEEGNWQ